MNLHLYNVRNTSKYCFHELSEILLRDRLYCQLKSRTRLTVKLSDNLAKIIKLTDAL